MLKASKTIIIRGWQARPELPFSEYLKDIRLMIDSIPGLVWSTGPDGSAAFFNQRWLEYTGLSSEQALGWG